MATTPTILRFRLTGPREVTPVGPSQPARCTQGNRSTPLRIPQSPAAQISALRLWAGVPTPVVGVGKRTDENLLRRCFRTRPRALAQLTRQGRRDARGNENARVRRPSPSD